MPADHVLDLANDVDELHRGGVIVRVSADDVGVTIVKVSHAPETYVLVQHNDEAVVDLQPDAETRAALEAALQAALEARSVTDRLREAIAARTGAATTQDELATIAAEEAAKVVAASEVTVAD